MHTSAWLAKKHNDIEVKNNTCVLCNMQNSVSGLYEDFYIDQ